MAKVTGPLQSMTASGSIGATITMLHQFSRGIAKKKSAPRGAPSSAQVARRDFYRTAANQWAALSQPAKDAYKPAAIAARITAFNAYMRETLNTFGAPSATIWDGGATAWDGGSTAWD